MDNNSQHNHNKPMFGTVWIVAYVLFFAVGLITCCYGYAAVNSAVYISGEATVMAPPGTFGVTYMQELTSKICAETNAGTHEQLRDMRDEQEYWVIKLKNGHCWMAQDLRLTLTSEGLTSELSDINESKLGNYDTEETSDGDVIYKWNENSYYPPSDTFYVGEGEKFTNTSSNFLYVYSYDFGEYIMNDPHGAVQGCTSNSYGPAACPDHATPIAGNWKPTLDYTTAGVTFENGKYDAHYKVGIYYTFITAAAGSYRSGASGRGLTAPSSICPRGWKLPGHLDDQGRTEMQLGGLETDDPTGPPYYLVRAGHLQTSNLNSFGVGSQYLKNYTMPSDSSHVFTYGSTFNSSRVKTYYAGTVRCVLRGEGE